MKTVHPLPLDIRPPWFAWSLVQYLCAWSVGWLAGLCLPNDYRGDTLTSKFISSTFNVCSLVGLNDKAWCAKAECANDKLADVVNVKMLVGARL